MIGLRSCGDGVPAAQTVKESPARREAPVRSLGWEDPLEQGTATYSRILAWRILWTEEPGGLQSIEKRRVRHDLESNTHVYAHTHTHAHICVCIYIC